MKRTIIILTVVVIYVFAVWTMLVSLPFLETPPLLKTLFTKNWQSFIVWMKIRHAFSVAVVGGILALLLVRYDKRTAQIDALIIGAFSVLWAVFFQWVITGINISITWIEITDYLVIGLAIPVLVAVIRKLTWSQLPSNNEVVQDAAKDAAPHTP